MADHATDESKLVTLAEASARLGVTPSRLRQMALNGDLPGAVKVGTQWTIGEAQLDLISRRRRARAASRNAAARHRMRPDGAQQRFVRPVSSPRFVDRVAERAELRRIIATPPAVAVVVGEAGAGKTRLVTEALREEEHVTVAIGRAQSQREPFLLGPVVEAARALAPHIDLDDAPPMMGALRLLLPELAQQLPPLPETSSPLAERHLLFGAMVEYLARAGSCVCVLEDLHWADRATQDFVAFLKDRMPRNMILVVTLRREDVHASSPLLTLATRPIDGVECGRIEVGPLEPDDVGILAAALLDGAEVSSAFAVCLHEKTLGIPLAVEAVTSLLRGNAELVGNTNETWIRHHLDALGVPLTLKDAVIATVAGLLPDTRRLVEAAAITGEPVQFDLLRHVAAIHPPADTDALRGALESGLLTEHQARRYGFRHALAREAVYESIPSAERTRLHLRTARAVESQTPDAVALLAHQYRAAERTPKWLQYAERAADEAAAKRDYDSAASFLLPAVTSEATPTGVVARVAATLATAALRGHVWQEETLEALREVIETRALPTVERGRLRGFVGLLLTETGHPAEGYQTHAAAALELRSNPQLAAVAMANLALPTSFEGRESDHRQWLRRAVDVAEQAGDERTRFGTSVVAALVPLYFGDSRALETVAAMPWHDPPPEQVESLLWLASHLVGGCIVLGHDRQAREYIERAAALANHAGRDRFRPLRDVGELLLDWTGGEWSGLDTRAGVAADSMRVEFPAGASWALAVEGSIHVARGDAPPATRSLRDAARVAEATGVIPALASARAGLAHVALQAGQLDAAIEQANRGLDPVARKGLWTWAGEIAPVLVATMLASHQQSQARGLVRHLERGLRGRDAPLPAAALSMCQGALAEHAGHVGDAAAAYARAAALYASMPRPYEEARARTAQARMMLKAGNIDAGPLLIAALDTFEHLGASAAAEVRAICRKHAVVLPARTRGGRRPRYGSALSPQEIRVVELVAAGRSTTEISDALFLAPRTVMHHVSSAMRKLGVHSRVALVSTWLQRAGR